MSSYSGLASIATLGMRTDRLLRDIQDNEHTSRYSGLETYERFNTIHASRSAFSKEKEVQIP
jgi:hypothetical protein